MLCVHSVVIMAVMTPKPMSLEGLDIEEDADEKTMKKEEEALEPLSWFPGQCSGEGSNEVEEEPASKKLKY